MTVMFFSSCRTIDSQETKGNKHAKKKIWIAIRVGMNFISYPCDHTLLSTINRVVSVISNIIIVGKRA